MITDRHGDNWWVVYGAKMPCFSNHTNLTPRGWESEYVHRIAAQFELDARSRFSGKVVVEVQNMEHFTTYEVEYAVILRLIDLDDIAIQKLTYEGFQLERL